LAPDLIKVHLSESHPSTPPLEPVKEPLSPPPAPKKVSKWQSLPKREPLSRNCQLPAKFHDEDQSAYLSNTAFALVTIMSNPRTLKEALLSSHSKQWEKAVESKFNELVKAKVFDWIEHLPNDKKAVGSRIVFKEKLDGYGKHVKFKAQIVMTWQNVQVIIYIFFLFFFFFFGLTTTRWSVGKYHMTLSQCHIGVTDGHRWSRHSHSHKVSHD